MDPDANVRERIAILERITRTTADRARLRELDDAYREWVAAGGFRASRELLARLAEIRPMVETRATVHTWANNYGVWHVRVSRTAAGPLIAARRALRDELQARESRTSPVARDVWMRPIRVRDLDNAETIVYRERFIGEDAD